MLAEDAFLQSVRAIDAKVTRSEALRLLSSGFAARPALHASPQEAPEGQGSGGRARAGAAVFDGDDDAAFGEWVSGEAGLAHQATHLQVLGI